MQNLVGSQHPFITRVCTERLSSGWEQQELSAEDPGILMFLG